MPLRKLCISPGCPEYSRNGTRCARHSAEHERGRSPRRAAYADPTYKRTRQVLIRGGAPCAACGTRADLTVDHIIPLSAGGTNHPSNLQVLCRSCNSRKGGEERRAC